MPHALLINPPYRTITSRLGVGHQVPLGLGVEEYEPNGRAADEVRRALNWILERIRGAAL